MSNTREPATIKSARDAEEDHGIRTVMVQLAFDGGGQMFGGLIYGPQGSTKEAHLRADFIEDLCATFGVAALSELVGKKCCALRSWKDSDQLEGLESADTGRRFLLTRWRRKHFPETASPLDDRRASMTAAIERHERENSRLRAQRLNLEVQYVNWEAM
jgi:hypothetical protein